MCTAHPTGRSRRTALAYPNGAGIAYGYDAASRLLAIDNQTGSGQYRYAYLYDRVRVGNRTDMTVTDPSSSRGHAYQYDTSGNMIYDGHYVFDYDPENRLNKVKRFEQGPTALALAYDTTLTFTMGGDADWFTQTQEHYFEGDAAQSGDIGDHQGIHLTTSENIYTQDSWSSFCVRTWIFVRASRTLHR